MTEATPLRIGLNLLYLMEGAGGAGRYAQELMPAMLELEPDTQLVGFATKLLQRSLLEQPWAAGIEWVLYDVAPGSRRAFYTQMLRIRAEAARRRLDVVHSPANIGLLRTARAANVVTLLDLIWLHPETSPLGKRERITNKVVFTRCARAADRILTISEATKRDLVATVGLAPDRIEVTCLGVREPAAVTSEDELRRRFDFGNEPILLCIAQKQPHKNLGSLIRTLPELEHAVLVLAGATAPHEAELRRMAAELGVAQRVRLLDWVDDRDLAGLYRAARGFVLPSFIEGFGLPVLEAMQAGTPVACSDRSALAEVAGDAALLFDPADQAAVTNAVSRLLADEELRADLVRRGRERVPQFTWRRTAQLTLDAYRRALASRRGA